MPREIDARSLVRAAAGPETRVRVYDTRNPKFERPAHNPFAGIEPDAYDPPPGPSEAPGE